MMACECKCSDNGLSREQQRQLNEATATVDTLFQHARKKVSEMRHEADNDYPYIVMQYVDACIKVAELQK